MPLYLVKAIQVLDGDQPPYAFAIIAEPGSLYENLDKAKRELAIAVMREARQVANGYYEFNILWDEPMAARCVVRSFDANGNYGPWTEAAIGRVTAMQVQ